MTPKERIKAVLDRVRRGDPPPPAEPIEIRPCDPATGHHLWESSTTPADEALCGCGTRTYYQARMGMALDGKMLVNSWQVRRLWH